MNFLNTETMAESRVQKIHFVGIGGSGMSGIAEVLLNEGYQISGSDPSQGQTIKHLQSLGATIAHQHEEQNIVGVDIVVVSTAISNDNPEVVAAKKARIPVIPRAQMLAELMRSRFGIAIAGTHGKTTTTSLVTSILSEGGLDPTFVIGGLLNSAGTNARLGSSNYLVAEADESDASFLYLKPQMTVVTNIDADHLWQYDNNFDNIKKTFVEFIHHLPLDGLAVFCLDDPIVRELLPQMGRPMLTYGFSEDADVVAESFSQQGTQCHFKVSCKKWANSLTICLNLPGKHNVLNALSAITIAKELGIDDDAIIRALANFQGVGRRLQVKGYYDFANGSALVVDDYGHHPREMTVTQEAIRAAWPDHRLVVAFQPHRYFRTQSLFEDFVQILSKPDALILLEIYSAGEKPIPGIDSRSLCRAIRTRAQVEPVYVGQEDNFIELLDNVLQDGDILLLQGAGDIGTIANQLPVRKPT